jgi:hypothetical protein
MSEKQSAHELHPCFRSSVFIKTPLIEQASKLRLRDLPASVFFQSTLNDRKNVFVWLIGFCFLLAPFLGLPADVADRRFPRKYTLIDF